MSADQHRASFWVRLGQAAGAGAQTVILPSVLASTLGISHEDLEHLIIDDLFIEQYHSDCTLPIAFKLREPLDEACNFVADGQLPFRTMGILWPKSTSLVPYRLTGDNKEKSAYSRAYIEQGIRDVGENSVSLDKASVLAQEVATRRGERDAVSGTRTEVSQAIAGLLKRGRPFDLRQGLGYQAFVVGREGGELNQKDNAYLLLGMVVTVRRPAAAAPATATDSEADDTALVLEALRVAEGDDRPVATISPNTSVHQSDAEVSDSPLTPLMTADPTSASSLI